MENYFFPENYITSEEAASYNVSYYQPLPITRYQVSFYANNYFDLLLIVSSFFKATDQVMSQLMVTGLRRKKTTEIISL